MSQGVVLFAYNNEKVDYFKMAVATAKRVNQFLNLPVTVVTDENTDIDTYGYSFDKVVVNQSDTSNTKNKNIWINKGRYKVYDITPYDDTVVLDTDYLINSDTLLKTFQVGDDFCCHNRTSFLMNPNAGQELLSNLSVNTLWATVMRFKKSNRTKQLFECMGMVQHNYSHYANLYHFLEGTYRNDYALTVALRIVNGHTEDLRDYIPWNLVHVDVNTKVYKESNTEYTILFDNWKNGKSRKEYITIKDSDFHMMNKTNFMELVDD